MHIQMIENFQCPGCTIGSDTKCGYFKQSDSNLGCRSHSAGTFMGGVGCINLGLPKGFCRNGPIDKTIQGSIVRIFEEPQEYDRFNVAAWAIVQDGFVFVRCYQPRINTTWVDIYPGDAIPKGSIDVADFIDEID